MNVWIQCLLPVVPVAAVVVGGFVHALRAEVNIGRVKAEADRLAAQLYAEADRSGSLRASLAAMTEITSTAGGVRAVVTTRNPYEVVTNPYVHLGSGTCHNCGHSGEVAYRSNCPTPPPRGSHTRCPTCDRLVEPHWERVRDLRELPFPEAGQRKAPGTYPLGASVAPGLTDPVSTTPAVAATPGHTLELDAMRARWAEEDAHDREVAARVDELFAEYRDTAVELVDAVDEAPAETSWPKGML